jgi:hypothetical protein
MFSSNTSSAAGDANYIEEVFQTWLYTGNGTSQTITNGVDLSGKGGLVWIKGRGVDNHMVFDTERGANKRLNTNGTAASFTGTDMLTSFGASGFSLGADTDSLAVNASGDTYVSWTFREQPKFFDVVTYTGDGTNNRAIAHNLGSVPGCIIVKSISPGYAWTVKHRSLTASQYLVLNDTAAAATTLDPWSLDPTSAVFYVNGVASSLANGNGVTYVAYLFAHDAGGFGLSGTDNVISCGSYTGTGAAGNEITLGYEPQWLMIKRTDAANEWHMQDIMRGSPVSGSSSILYANQSSAEFGSGSNPEAFPTATGFTLRQNTASVNASGGTYIYIAIRRGPMKVPTTGTSVLNLSARTGNANAGAGIGAGFTDLIITKDTAGSEIWAWTDRLRGRIRELNSSTATAETSYSNDVTGFDRMDGVNLGTGSGGQVNSSGTTYINYLMRRAPNVFDEVCYTGNSTLGATQSHNLRVAPELIIVKVLNTGANWAVYSQALGATKYLMLNQTSASTTSSVFWLSLIHI